MRSDQLGVIISLVILVVLVEILGEILIWLSVQLTKLELSLLGC